MKQYAVYIDLDAATWQNMIPGHQYEILAINIPWDVPWYKTYIDNEQDKRKTRWTHSGCFSKLTRKVKKESERFEAFTVIYNDLPDDVNRNAFETGGVEEYYEDYLVVQVNGSTVFCRPESQLSDGLQMTTDLMNLAYFLGVTDGMKNAWLKIYSERRDEEV